MPRFVASDKSKLTLNHPMCTRQINNAKILHTHTHTCVANKGVIA